MDEGGGVRSETVGEIRRTVVCTSLKQSFAFFN
jgi:hypothetical protein